MIWRIVEDALASAMSRAMLEARLETLFERVRHLGVLSEAEMDRLRAEIRTRLEEVERDGREYRQLVDRFVRSLVDRFLAPQLAQPAGRRPCSCSVPDEVPPGDAASDDGAAP